MEDIISDQKSDWRDKLRLNKQAKAVSYGGIRFEFPYWGLLPGIDGGSGDLISREMKKSIKELGVLEHVTIEIPEGQEVEIVNGRLQRTDDNDVIDVGDNEGELVPGGYEPTVRVLHGELRVRGAYAVDLPVAQIPFAERGEFDADRLEKIDAGFKKLLRNQNEKDLYDSFPEDLKHYLRSFYELCERDIRSKNGLAPSARIQFVGRTDALWPKLGFSDVMPQRALGNICSVKARTIGRDRDIINCDKDPDFETLFQRRKQCQNEKEVVHSASKILTRKYEVMDTEDYEAGTRGLDALKKVLGEEIRKCTDLMGAIQKKIFEKDRDRDIVLFGAIEKWERAGRQAAETDPAKLLEDQNVTNVTDSVDENWIETIDDAISEGEESE